VVPEVLKKNVAFHFMDQAGESVAFIFRGSTFSTLCGVSILEYAGNTFLQNDGNHAPINTLSQPRNSKSSIIPLRKPQKLYINVDNTVTNALLYKDMKFLGGAVDEF
jgi:hypothetical protein